jgi:hypothetical protein
MMRRWRPLRHDAEDGDLYAIKRRPARHDAEGGDLNANRLKVET